MGIIVSAICPTYGRYPERGYLLEEAVESFRRQSFPADQRELLIISDAPGQRLECDLPNVRIINMPWRFSSLGAKYNFAVTLARGSYILPAEDDDLSLSNRIAQAVDHIGNDPYWNPQQVYYWEYGQPPRQDHGGVALNASIFRKDAWQRVGGFPARSGDQDQHFDRALRQLGPMPAPLRPDEQPQYIYRWNVSDLHLSGNSDHEAAYRAYGQKPVTAGTFKIEPRYRPETEAVMAELTGLATSAA